MKTVAAIGEVLIDFIPLQKGAALKDVVQFERAAGGAPANVAAAVAKLGGRSVMISKLGNDAFGDYLTETLSSYGVGTQYLFRHKDYKTALAFVSLSEDGNRDFSFYRAPSADLYLDENDIDGIDFSGFGILHFGSVDLVDFPVKKAHIRAIGKAKENGAVISFDPNIRLPLWNSPEECRKAVREFIPYADIVKISDNELEFVTGKTKVSEGIEYLFSKGVKLAAYTKGGSGAELYSRTAYACVPAAEVKAADTTGAGDSFTGAMLYRLSKLDITPCELEKLDRKSLEDIAEFSCMYAGYTACGKGGATAMATAEQFRAFLASMSDK